MTVCVAWLPAIRFLAKHGIIHHQEGHKLKSIECSLLALMPTDGREIGLILQRIF